ncbi:MAG: lipid A deacylase LpxR family protein [Desulfobacteraceae bacterium]|nr:lipid A deacylase LpxR family protein [Desulfobacteraceae bacterium]
MIAGLRRSLAPPLHFSNIFLILLLSIALFAAPLSAAPAIDETPAGDASGKPNLSTVGLYLENDYFAGTDGGYTSGLKLSWSSAIQDVYPNVWPHRWLYPLIKWIPFEKAPDRQRNITFSLGQNIFTPQDIESREVVKDDRPYAGITYVSLGFHNRMAREMDSVEVSAGLVGPASGAEECQKTVHWVFNDIKPQGWDNQLKNEPVLGLVYEHKKKIAAPDTSGGFGYDVILNTGGGLGNALTYYNLGLLFRTGWNLPGDFGVMPIRPISSFNSAVMNTNARMSSKIGVQLFVSMEGRAVLRNIFLDGNTFTNGPSVNKKPAVGDFMTGIAFSLGQGQLSFAYVTRSKEFDTQKKAEQFASINLSCAY